MTSGRRSKQHRRDTVPPTPNWGRPSVDFGLTVGWAETDAELEDCRRRTHDQVIGYLGDARTGPVTWHMYEGKEATAALDELTRYETEEAMLTVYRRCRGKIREFGGILVVATAPAVAPDQEDAQ